MSSESRRLLEEDLFDKSPEQWAREAAEAEEKRYRAEHGPEDAPPKPPWPVYWCECRGGMWSPRNAIHECATPHPMNWRP